VRGFGVVDDLLEGGWRPVIASADAGNADIVRESIDGATMYLLLAALEGW
jgi:hypothetical protein